MSHWLFRLLKLLKNYIAMFWSSIFTTLIWAIGGFDYLIKALLFLMIMDYITGVWVGFRTNTVNSKRAYKGLEKKIMVLTIICCTTVIARLMPSTGIRNIVGIFYCATEFLSVIENAAKLGAPFPESLKKALEQCKGNQCTNLASDKKVDKKIDIDLDEEMK